MDGPDRPVEELALADAVHGSRRRRRRRRRVGVEVRLQRTQDAHRLVARRSGNGWAERMNQWSGFLFFFFFLVEN